MPDFGAALPPRVSPEVLDFLALRRSASAVSLAAPAPDAAQLADLLRLASRVPDHGKLTPWRFIVVEGEAKAALASKFETLAQGRDPSLVAKLAKLKVPPLAVFVVFSPKESPIPEWEQILSAGAVATNLLYASLAMGFGANWITDWYSYDADATGILGLAPAERVTACMLIGTVREPPLERERPQVKALISYWRNQGG